MGMLTPDEMAGITPDTASKRLGIIKALIDTAERTTDLEGVYNDKDLDFYSWEEVYQMVDELLGK